MKLRENAMNTKILDVTVRNLSGMPDAEKNLKMTSDLKLHVCEVAFTKVNGDERQMTCTLLETEMPASDASKSTKKENLDVIACWDTKAEGWRSFRVDSVKEFKVING